MVAVVIRTLCTCGALNEDVLDGEWSRICSYKWEFIEFQ